MLSLTSLVLTVRLPIEAMPPPTVRHAFGPVAIAVLWFTSLLVSVRSVQLRIPAPFASLARRPPT